MDSTSDRDFYPSSQLKTVDVLITVHVRSHVYLLPCSALDNLCFSPVLFFVSRLGHHHRRGLNQIIRTNADCGTMTPYIDCASQGFKNSGSQSSNIPWVGWSWCFCAGGCRARKHFVARFPQAHGQTLSEQPAAQLLPFFSRVP